MSIKNKLILSVVLVHMVLISLFVANSLSRQKDFLIAETRAQTLNFATLLAENVLSWVLAEDLAGMEEVVQAAGRLPQIGYAMVADQSGKILTNTDKSRTGVFLNGREAEELLTSSEFKTHVWCNDPLYIHVAAPLLIQGNPVGWVLVGTDLTNVAAHLQDIYTQGLLYIFVAMVCGVLAAWMLSSTIFRQLTHIMGGIRRLQNNDFSACIPVSARDEFGQMAVALNKASGFLRLSQNTLKKEIEERMRAEQQIMMLTRRLVDGNEEERKRLGHDLHDELGQSVTGLLFGLHALKQSIKGKNPEALELCEQVIREAREFGDEVRRVAAGQYPVVLERLGLAAEATAMLAEISARNAQLRLDYSVDLPAERLHPRVEISCYRVLQEGLGNVLRHSGASHAQVCIATQKNWIYLHISDNGHGFDAEGMLNQTNEYRGIGIMGMQARVLAVDGNMEIDSAPGKGCVIDVFLPLIFKDNLHEH